MGLSAVWPEAKTLQAPGHTSLSAAQENEAAKEVDDN